MTVHYVVAARNDSTSGRPSFFSCTTKSSLFFRSILFLVSSKVSLILCPVVHHRRTFSTMGGDDLGDDDAYLLEPVVAESDDEDDNDVDVSSKRPHDEQQNSDDGDPNEPPPKKHKRLNNETLLIQAGCGIESSPAKDQLSFLRTSLKHYTMLAAAGKEKPNNLDFSLKEKSLVTSSKDTLLDRLRDVVSLKKLKKHRETRSPAVVIVCQSARRAVAVLKELSGLHLRATKLFPKNGEVDQQVTQLRQNPFPLAVGTPHRLVALCGHPKGLSFEHTQLVVLDTFVSNKQFTVW